MLTAVPARVYAHGRDVPDCALAATIGLPRSLVQLSQFEEIKVVIERNIENARLSTAACRTAPLRWACLSVGTGSVGLVLL